MDNNLYDNSKKKKIHGSTPESSIYHVRLTKDSFVVDTPGISFKIVNEEGTQDAHYLCDQLVSIELIEDKIIIYTSDKTPITYVFVSKDDAKEANEKINNIINAS